MIKDIRYSGILILLIAIIWGCKKPSPLSGTTAETALISVTNVNASSKTVDVYIDGVKANQSAAIATNASVTGTYIGTTPGTHTFEIRDNATNAVYSSTSISVEGGKSYSAFVYGVSTAGTLKTLFLQTDRTLPDSVSTNVRFLNLSPNSPALDVWLIRRLGAVNTDSSILYSNVPYVGSTTPDVNSLSTFKKIKSGVSAGAPGFATTQDYIIRLKLSGTSTIVATSASITFIPTKIYTIYVRGTYPSLTISTLLHN